MKTRRVRNLGGIVPCPCGCGPMREKTSHGMPRQYAGRGCFFRDPARKHQVAKMLKAANDARKAKVGVNAANKAERYPSKRAAYLAGYKAGYNRAYHWWKAAKSA